MKFVSSAKTMQQSSQHIPKGSGYVDTRQYADGRVRLRFRLTASQTLVVDEALSKSYSITHTLAEAKALSDICLAFITDPPELGHPLASSPPDAKKVRRLFKLYEDQYELVRYALDIAREHTGDDAGALTMICMNFITTYEGDTSWKH